MSVSGTSMKSSQTGVSARRPKITVPPHLAVRCLTCGELFNNQQELMMHRLWAMKIDGTHVHCTICTMEFETMETQQKHMLEMHPQEQNLVCPGCQRKYVRLAGFMKHIEHNECPAIKRHDVDKNRAEKLNFAHELEKRSGSQFGDYFPASHPSVQSAGIEAKPYQAHPSFFKPGDFPELKEVEDINNPYHPGFDASKYLNPFTKKYRCPHASCKKNFPTPGALIGHMKASVGHYNAKLQCPACLRWFKDASALAAHCESESNRCDIRKSENYRIFLDQLTGGMVDVVGKHEDSTRKYDVSTEAIIKFGPTQQAKKAAENFMAANEADTQEQWVRNNQVW